jgi:uncharacterized protein YjbJ (UPF0337 family)
MNDNKTEGAAKVALGRFESAVGEALGDEALQTRGGARQVGGRVQEAVGSVQDALGQAAETTRAAVTRASDAYGRVSHTARGLARRVEDQPFAAVAVATAIGLLAGLLIAERRPRIIYVKPRV